MKNHKSSKALTLHAPEERCDYEVLIRQRDYFNNNPLFKQGFDAINNLVLVLNQCRQVVFANKAFLTIVNDERYSPMFGKRIGEIIKCIHADNEIHGCGTGEACRYCNGVNILLQAMEKNEECSGQFSNINTRQGFEENFNALIHVAPLQVERERFFVVSITDNGDSLRRKMLEKTFFHDILNTVGALKGIVGLLKEDVPIEIKGEVEFIEKTFGHLIEEIQMQKNIMEAENNELILELAAVDSFEILSSVGKLYDGHEVSKNKIIKINNDSIQTRFYVDYKLLRRILGNMIKNALEATEKNGVVTIGCSLDNDKAGFIQFWVHNDKYMDKMTQNLVFHRSFSTKGEGRGLGTYSMNLIGRKYLGGSVGFSSNEKDGTTFYITIPLHLSTGS